MTRNRILFSLAVATLSASLVACGGSTSEGASNEPAGSEDALRRSGFVDIKDSDDGKTLVVEKGQKVRLTLSSNATTGYKWGVTSTNRTFGYPSPAEGTYESASDGPVGSGGKQVFVWKTDPAYIRAGDTVHHVELEYRRSFEDTATAAAKKFSFGVKIKAAAATEPARECPSSQSVNCMPPTDNPQCASDFRAWATANCDVSYLD